VSEGEDRRLGNGGGVAAPPSSEPRDEAAVSRSARVRARKAALQARAQALADRAQRERDRHSSVDALFEIADRDAEVGGGIIAGALAYRLFIWLLPAALVFYGGLGLASQATSDSPQAEAGKAGLAGLVATSFNQNASSTASWYAILIGIPILVYVTRSVLRVLIGTHRLAWGDVRAAAPKPTLKASLILLVLILLCFGIATVASWVRANWAGPGLVVTIAAAAGFAGVWLVVSLRLPHREADWIDLAPGAGLFGVGVGIVQILAAYLLGPYALAKQGTYGALGLAAALLFSLFVLGRLVMAAAEVNATLWDRKRARG
jgi:membrane protein